MGLIMNTSEYASAQPSNLNKNAIADLAAQLADQINYKPGNNLEKVVSDLGGEIQYMDLYGVGLGGNSDSGSIKIDGFRSFNITLAHHTGVLRDRFTIAHEVGHYVLHYLYPKQVLKQPLTKVIAQRYGFGLEETEANLFAACFLMPEEAYRAAYKKLGGSHTDLSEEFGVSTRSSRLRASNLSLK